MIRFSIPSCLIPFFLLVFALLNIHLAFAQDAPEPTTQTKEQFAQSLSDATADALGDKEKFSSQAVHWVLLIDTSQYQGTAPVAAASGQVLETLFGTTIREGDHVSILPFQSTPSAFTVWNQPVTTFEALRPLLPGTSAADGHRGGRDIEGAVKAALTRLQAEGQMGKAVILVISSSRFSEVPTGEPNFPLTTSQNPPLQSLLKAQNMTPSIALVPIATSQNGGNKVIPLYLQTYLPASLVGVGALATSPKPPPVIPGRPVINPPLVVVNNPPGFLARFWWLLILVLIILALIIRAVVYWLTRSPAQPPLLVLDHTNRRFPKSGLMEFYGPGMATSEGTDTLPTKLSLSGLDLPPSASGKLFTLDTRGREQAILTPYLYTGEPKALEYDREIALRLKPTEGVDGAPMTQRLTLQRKEKQK